MHIKFINTGKGSAGAAQKYLLREHDSKGEIRESVQVLRGNPDQVTAVAESLEFKHTYRSAVIAWHKDDRPTPEQINEVLDDFERVAFAGLEPNQYTYYAVWHGEAKSGHIHIVTPRVELQTGKSLNIAPPGWQKTYDLIRDKFNIKYNWASPGEKSRQRLAVQGKIELHADMPRNKAKEMIDAAVSDRIEAGLIRNRADVVAFLGEIGEITREGKDYLSVKPFGFKKAIRLKGAAYGREFSIERLGEKIRAEQRERIRRSEADRRREVERIESAIERTVEQRYHYHRTRYRQSAAADQSKQQRNNKANRGNEQASDQRPVANVGADERASKRDRENKLRVGVGHNSGIVDDHRGNWSDIYHEKPASSEERDNSRGGNRIPAEEIRGSSSGRRELEAAKKGEIDDRVRERVAAYCTGATQGIYSRVAADIQSIRAGSERMQAEYAAGERIRDEAEQRLSESPNLDEYTERGKDQLRSRAAELFSEPAHRIEQAIRRIGEIRQRFGEAVKRCVDAVNRRHDRDTQQSYDIGPSM